MSRLLVLVFCFAGYIAAAPGVNDHLLRVRNIYVMSMPRGLDQYLANRIVREAEYQVVTDPRLADAVLTDRLGPDFEQRFEQMFAEKEESEETSDEAKEAKGEDASSSLNTALAWAEAGTARTSSFSRAAGNLFLVDRGSKVVLWSNYRRPKRATADELYRVSDWLVDQLHEDRRRAAKKFPSGAVARPQSDVRLPPAPPGPVPEAPEPSEPPASSAPRSDSSQPDAK